MFTQRHWKTHCLDISVKELANANSEDDVDAGDHTHAVAAGGAQLSPVGHISQVNGVESVLVVAI